MDYEKNLTYDTPIDIGGLSLYPVKMLNYIDFFENIDCLLFNKNRIPNTNIISMSYLQFLLNYSSFNNKTLLSLEKILFLSFQLNGNKNFIEWESDKKNRPILVIKEFEEENENRKITKEWKFTYKDFNEIREIICKQNFVDMPDEKIDPKLESALLEAQAFINKKSNDLKVVSLEDQMISVLINTALNWESILNLSIRKFIKILERHDKELHYQIYKSASLSGMVEFKEPIVHFLYDKPKDKYAHLVSNYDEYMNKVDQVTNK